MTTTIVQYPDADLLEFVRGQRGLVILPLRGLPHEVPPKFGELVYFAKSPVLGLVEETLYVHRDDPAHSGVDPTETHRTWAEVWDYFDAQEGPRVLEALAIRLRAFAYPSSVRLLQDVVVWDADKSTLVSNLPRAVVWSWIGDMFHDGEGRTPSGRFLVEWEILINWETSEPYVHHVVRRLGDHEPGLEGRVCYTRQGSPGGIYE